MYKKGNYKIKIRIFAFTRAYNISGDTFEKTTKNYTPFNYMYRSKWIINIFWKNKL